MSTYNHVQHVVSVNEFRSIADLNGLIGANDGDSVYVAGYYESINDVPWVKGGGHFVWDSTKLRSEHNGVTVFSPTVHWDGTQETLADYHAGTWEIEPDGVGCWVREYDELNVYMAGAVGDGAKDDTVATQSALVILSFGQSLHIPSDCRLYIDSVITIPKGSSLIGDCGGWKGYADNRGNDGNPDFYSISPGIHFGESASIILTSGASVEKLMLIRTGMVFPVTYEQASVWHGACIEASGHNAAIIGCSIFGFGTGILCSKQRMSIRNNNIDCWNGIEITNNYDVGYIMNNHLWPFLSAFWLPTVATYDDLRRNIGFNIHDVADWLEVNNNFAYGYLVGYLISNVSAVSLVNCGADNIPPTNSGYHQGSIGFHILGSNKIKLINCNVAAQETGVIFTDSDFCTLSNSCFWANVDHGILFNSGSFAVTDTSIQSRGESGNDCGITYNDSTSLGLLTINNVNISGYSGTKIPINVNANVTTDLLQIQSIVVTASSSPAVRGVGSLSVKPLASAGNVVIPPQYDLFFVTGTTNIGNFITETWNGRRITLVFQNSLTLVHSVSLKLSGGVNALMTAFSVITFIFVGGAWTEMSRSIK